MVDVDQSVTLHSSWKGVLLSAVGATVVFGVGLGGTISSGGAGVPVVILGLGVILLLTVLFDYPIASRFTPEFVERRAVLRRHKIPWEGVDQLTRSRPGLVGLRNLKPGGLAAKVGRRRYLLVDQCEAIAEFDQLGDVLAARYVELGVDEMIPPHAETEPTWTYRRRCWQPDP
ncbi:hypothetical protein [uncultured Ilumatobacter sp.]|jgi:hypothetical protein|uniref:hypothetical protein n=1 Tax=uncultured Ilumatobacter sp. TaxID=879968 RepID=UPI00374EEDA3